VLQNGHFRQLLRDQPCDSLGDHSANQFLKAATNLNFVSRNGFKLLVKMISASPIAGCPSFKFLTMQMQPSASCARMSTVLSATIMFADKPHRLNERTSAQRFCVLTSCLRLRHSRLGYRAAGYRRSDFVRCAGFSDAGMTRLSTRCGGRRPKSAKARSRGKYGTRQCSELLWGCMLVAISMVDAAPA